MADTQAQQHKELMDMLAVMQRQLGILAGNIQLLTAAIQRMTPSPEKPPEPQKQP